MKKLYVVMAVVAAIMTGILSFVFFTGYANNGGNGKVALGQTEKVVVAVVDIDAYTEITPEMVALKDVAASAVHPNATKKLEEVVGQITERDIVVYEQVLTNKIAKTGDEGKSFSFQIPDGKRAFTIATDVNTGVGGYIEPGDLIDVLVTMSVSPKAEIDVNGEEKSIASNITYPVVEAVEVAKLGDVSFASAGTAVYSSITLFLDPEECAKLYTAESIGSLKVVLRQKADESPFDSGIIDSSSIFD